MRQQSRSAILIVSFLFFAKGLIFAADSTNGVRTLNTPREFPKITTEAQWRERAATIREQILVSSGLWPMPEKTPIKATIFGKVEREGYSVEKVYFQTYPGFYLGGNLYRPLGKGTGPFPAVLNAHGHWEKGRLMDTADCSVPARCINFALQGMVAFAYDMVGYNDTRFTDTPNSGNSFKIHRNFATNDPANLLWNISLMGLQTWNSERALDFIVSLPDVDTNRMAITGASGGGTQTFILGAIDYRLAAQAPVVMVSHTMQGGCGCENMPGLRVEFSNMEIAAAPAPRPQIMVASTGDWTKTMLEVEGPAVGGIYQLFKTPGNLRYVRFDFQHNYNQTSREAVYQWFAKTLRSQPDMPVKEHDYKKEPDEALRVFPDGQLPTDALSQNDFIASLKKLHQEQLKSLQPKDTATWQNYKKFIEPVLNRTLQVGHTGQFLETKKSSFSTTAAHGASPGYRVEEEKIQGDGETDAVTVLHFAPMRGNLTPPAQAFFFILADPKGSSAFCDASGAPKGLARHLLDKGFDVAVVKSFPEVESRDQTSVLYNCYNRTYLQQRVRDLIDACNGAPGFESAFHRVVLVGTGHAGLWSLLAAPHAHAVIADCAQLDVSDDKALLAHDLFCPGIRNIDTFNGALQLAAPHPLLLHNTAGKFPTTPLAVTYAALRSPEKFRAEKDSLSDEQIAEWISKLK